VCIQNSRSYHTTQSNSRPFDSDPYSGALLSSLVCWIEFADEGKGSGFAFSILSMLLGVGAAVLAMVGKKCTFMDESVGGVRVKSFALPVGVG